MFGREGYGKTGGKTQGAYGEQPSPARFSPQELADAACVVSALRGIPSERRMTALALACKVLIEHPDSISATARVEATAAASDAAEARTTEEIAKELEQIASIPFETTADEAHMARVAAKRLRSLDAALRVFVRDDYDRKQT